MAMVQVYWDLLNSCSNILRTLIRIFALTLREN